MPDQKSAPSELAKELECASEAVVICTRNRPDDLGRTLASLAKQVPPVPLLLVIDASDAPASGRNRHTVASLSGMPVKYLSYPYRPSLARQRNFALEHLPPGVEVVHFLDDDVTLLPGYLKQLSQTLEARPELGGVGGLVLREASHPEAGLLKRLFRRLFLLDAPNSGRVLPSGWVTQFTPTLAGPPRPTSWLTGGAASYRRHLIASHRFDDRLDGYSLMEDIDFSFRVSRHAQLALVPEARLIHHRSSMNRMSMQRYARDEIVHRYWFVEKNIDHPLRKPAYWWALVGRMIALLNHARGWRRDVLISVGRGVHQVIRRSHPLLKRTTHI